MVAGMEEAGQRHDETLHEEDRSTPSPGHFGRDLTYGGSAPAGGMMDLMDRMPPGQAGRFLEDVAVCLDLVAHVEACRRPRGANVLPLGCSSCPKTANVSLRGA
jgi:hypothetical protein